MICVMLDTVFLIVFLCAIKQYCNLKLKLSVNTILGMCFFPNVPGCTERSVQPLMQAAITQELEAISDVLVSHTGEASVGMCQKTVLLAVIYFCAIR